MWWKRGEGKEDQLGFGVLIALGHKMHCIGTHSALCWDTQYCAQDWDLRLYTVVLANKWKVWDTKVKMWVSSGIKLRCSIHPLPSFKKLRMREARQEDTAMAQDWTFRSPLVFFVLYLVSVHMNFISKLLDKLENQGALQSKCWYTRTLGPIAPLF